MTKWFPCYLFIVIFFFFLLYEYKIPNNLHKLFVFWKIALTAKPHEKPAQGLLMVRPQNIIYTQQSAYYNTYNINYFFFLHHRSKPPAERILSASKYTDVICKYLPTWLPTALNHNVIFVSTYRVNIRMQLK